MVRNSNKFPKTEFSFQGHRVIFTWIRTSNLLDYQPWTQVYGICFNSKGQILIIKEKEWKIPGGTPRKGESPEETLKRELIEEADTVISKCWPLGVQKVDYPDNPDANMKIFYQYRYVCLIEKLLPQTPDPDNGLVHPRKLIPVKEITRWVKWGPTGKAMFKDAIELFGEKFLSH